MPLILPGNVGSATATTGYDVANSLRFNSGSSDNLSRTQSTGNQRTYTVSFWVKRSALDNQEYIVSARYGNQTRYQYIRWNGDSDSKKNCLDIFSGIYSTSSTSTSMYFVTNRVFRDVSAWYHIVLAVDTTQITESNRVKIYINGVQETSFQQSTYPSQNQQHFFNINTTPNEIGVQGGGSYLNSYLAEVVLVDGQQLDQTSFGEFDSDSPNIWKPIDVSGLTFGTNGFYLDFENASSLGADVSGNSNNFTVNNLTSVDQSTDTCTNNFATINSLENYYTPHTLSEGNLRQTTASSNLYAPSISTIALSQGKWYFECKYVSRSSSDNYNLIGVKSTQVTNTNYLGQNQHDYGYYSSSGKYYTNGSAVTYGDSYDQGDIIGVYLDLDNNKLYFAKNGALQNSGTGISITDPASTPLGHYFFAVGDYGSSLVIVNDWNFGGTQSFSISSGNTDPNGYGNFEYDPSSGTFDGGSKSFYALNTKNLAEFG